MGLPCGLRVLREFARIVELRALPVDTRGSKWRPFRVLREAVIGNSLSVKSKHMIPNTALADSIGSSLL